MNVVKTASRALPRKRLGNFETSRDCRIGNISSNASYRDNMISSLRSSASSPLSTSPCMLCRNPSSACATLKITSLGFPNLATSFRHCLDSGTNFTNVLTRSHPISEVKVSSCKISCSSGRRSGVSWYSSSVRYVTVSHAGGRAWSRISSSPAKGAGWNDIVGNIDVGSKAKMSLMIAQAMMYLRVPLYVPWFEQYKARSQRPTYKQFRSLWAVAAE